MPALRVGVPRAAGSCCFQPVDIDGWRGVVKPNHPIIFWIPRIDLLLDDVICGFLHIGPELHSGSFKSGAELELEQEEAPGGIGVEEYLRQMDIQFFNQYIYRFNIVGAFGARHRGEYQDELPMVSKNL